jgi:multiple antibiotic resistance protein
VNFDAKSRLEDFFDRPNWLAAANRTGSSRPDATKGRSMALPPNILSAFVTLFVTIGPIETAVVFASLTAGVHRQDSRSLATKAILIAGAMLTLFALSGTTALSLLHVSLPVFRVAGGVLLFLQALTLTFASPGLSSISEGERRDAERPGDIAVFPLAFPVIAGPGSLSAIVLLAARARSGIDATWMLLMLLVCLTLTYGAMFIAESLVHRLGQTGADVVGRVSGVLLAGLAVQFVFDGLHQVFVDNP